MKCSLLNFTAQKMKFPMKENFIFCAVFVILANYSSMLLPSKLSMKIQKKKKKNNNNNNKNNNNDNK